MSTYHDFLAAKVALAQHQGFGVQESEVNPRLKPHQRDLVRWGLWGGRRAWFAAFGLGKTYIQLEAMRLVGVREEANSLWCAPWVCGMNLWSSPRTWACPSGSCAAPRNWTAQACT